MLYSSHSNMLVYIQHTSVCMQHSMPAYIQHQHVSTYAEYNGIYGVQYVSMYMVLTTWPCCTVLKAYINHGSSRHCTWPCSRTKHAKLGIDDTLLFALVEDLPEPGHPDTINPESPKLLGESVYQPHLPSKDLNKPSLRHLI